MSYEADLELVRAACAGDSAAFAKLYERYLPPVQALAHARSEKPAEAADLTRDVLVAVFDHLDGYSGRVPLAAWVLVVARQVCEQRHASASERIARSA